MVCISKRNFGDTCIKSGLTIKNATPRCILRNDLVDWREFMFLKIYKGLAMKDYVSAKERLKFPQLTIRNRLLIWWYVLAY